MAHSIGDILAGSMGYFWPQPEVNAIELDSSPMSGIIQLARDDSLELGGLIEDAGPEFFNAERSGNKDPDYIVGSTEHGGILLSGTVEVRSSVTIGGSRASTRHFRCSSLVDNVNIHTLANGKVEEVSAHWLGLSRWAGVMPVEERVKHGDRGEVSSVAIELSRTKSLYTTIDDAGTELELGSTWTVSGPSDSRLISAPLSLTVTPPEPSGLESQSAVLISTRDILNIAFQGFVAAVGGSVIMNDPVDFSLQKRPMWNRTLMQVPPGAAEPKSMSEVPLFYLSDIGGMEGLARWIRLGREHPRLVRPVVSPYRIGRNYSEVMLVDFGASIDYWRGINKGRADWAAEKHQPAAVAQSIGPEFAEWVGDVKKWALHYWYHYNGLKHYIPNYAFDPVAVHWLALSGATLMTCVCLKEVCPESDLATTRALNSHRWTNRGSSVRDWLQSAPSKPGKRS